MRRKHKLLLVVAGVCIVVVVGDWSYKATSEQDTFVQYVGTIVATLAGVGVATYLSVRQFYSQAEKKDDERRRQLAQSLAAELLKMLDIFAGGPNLHMADPKATAPHLFPDELGPAGSPVSVHLVQLEPTATEEAIRVGLLDPQSTSNLSQLASLMRDYSMLSNNFYPLQYGPIWDPSYQERAYIIIRRASEDANKLDHIWFNNYHWPSIPRDRIATSTPVPSGP